MSALSVSQWNELLGKSTGWNKDVHGAESLAATRTPDLSRYFFVPFLTTGRLLIYFSPADRFDRQAVAFANRTASSWPTRPGLIRISS